MSHQPLYQKLAEAFAAEGVDTLFALLGDGNMHWATALAENHSVRNIYVRHEHCACAMATSYARASNKVGVASVTCGPGLTQISTALATAVQACVPLVVFSGDSPLGAAFYNQRIDQGPVVAATGAHHISAHGPKRMLDYVREAFFVARTERRPVVLSVPYDLQKDPWTGAADYLPSTSVIADAGPIAPNMEYVARAAAKIAQARRIILLAGRGARLSGAGAACEELAARCGALLATTLPACGLFDDDRFSLGVAGGFSSTVAREKFAEADLVIAVGASLSHHTADGGRLYPNASVIQVDAHPTGWKHGLEVADLYVRADAKAAVRAILGELGNDGVAGSAWRTPELARRIAEEPADAMVFEIEPGTLDPRSVVKALNDVLPRHWDIAASSGHCSYFSAHMRGRKAENFHVIREFGAIGNGLSYAMGVAAARPDSTIVLIDGDGGLLMHAQELETVRRHGLKILICVLNDGAYGSEIHKLRSDGISDRGAVFGRGDLSAVAKGFGLGGRKFTSLEGLKDALADFQRGGSAELWDFDISDRVLSPPMRNLLTRAAH